MSSIASASASARPNGSANSIAKENMNQYYRLMREFPYDIRRAYAGDFVRLFSANPNVISCVDIICGYIERDYSRELQPIAVAEPAVVAVTEPAPSTEGTVNWSYEFKRKNQNTKHCGFHHSGMGCRYGTQCWFIHNGFWCKQAGSVNTFLFLDVDQPNNIHIEWPDEKRLKEIGNVIGCAKNRNNRMNGRACFYEYMFPDAVKVLSPKHALMEYNPSSTAADVFVNTFSLFNQQ